MLHGLVGYPKAHRLSGTNDETIIAALQWQTSLTTPGCITGDFNETITIGVRFPSFYIPEGLKTVVVAVLQLLIIHAGDGKTNQEHVG